jgi:hypothetical protein
MGILVLMDFSRLMINRFRKPKAPSTPEAKPEKDVEAYYD